MRITFAAAFAALLVGVSPAGALPFASVAAAVASVQAEGASQRQGAAVAAVTCPQQQPALTRHSRASSSTRPVRAQARIWRGPSAPAPSQAPPAPRA